MGATRIHKGLLFLVVVFPFSILSSLYVPYVCHVTPAFSITNYEVNSCRIGINTTEIDFLFRPFSIIEHLTFNTSTLYTIPDNFFRKFELLRTCNMTDVQMQVLPRGSFKYAKALLTMDLTCNEINTLEEFFLDGATSLRSLNLSLNHIQTIHSEAFQRCQMLRVIVLRQNQLDFLPQTLLYDLVELQELDVSFNLIEAFPAHFFNKSGNLRILHASHNRLHVFDETIPVSRLCRLTLDENYLSTLVLTLDQTVDNICEPNLVEISANSNNISSIILPSFLQLNSLSLNGNSINDVKNITRYASSLQDLFLGSNPIGMSQILELMRLERLRNLSLSDVNISSLDFTIFSKLTDLMELDISSNHLYVLDLSQVQSLRMLTKLNISNNELEHFDFDYMRANFPILKVIDINHNRFGCEYLKNMLHNSFRRQKINATPKRGELQVKNHPNVDGVFCLQELNTGHLEQFREQLKNEEASFLALKVKRVIEKTLDCVTALEFRIAQLEKQTNQLMALNEEMLKRLEMIFPLGGDVSDSAPE